MKGGEGKHGVEVFWIEEKERREPTPQLLRPKIFADRVPDPSFYVTPQIFVEAPSRSSVKFLDHESLVDS
jgi:hypothetical protein